MHIKEQGIIIQGPTDFHHEEIANFYSQFSNVVWSTWKDEPRKHLDYIRDKGITLLLNYKPDYPGHLNINLQCKSTLHGIKYFKDRGFSEVIKVRSDILFWGIERVLDKIKGKDVSFMAMHNPNTLPLFAYYLDHYHHGIDFPCDYVIHGNIDTMHNMFDYYVKDNIPIPPESIILKNYLTYRNIEPLFIFDHLVKNGIYFFNKDCVENDASIIWTKRNPRRDLTHDITELESHLYIYK
jgi:hypothetical protein